MCKSMNWKLIAGGFALGLLPFILAGCDSADPAAGSGKAKVANVAIPRANVGKTEDGWHQSYADAAAESKAKGKPILMDFTGSDWCVWCIRLDQEVFEKEEFKKWAADNVVLLKLDYPQSKPQAKDVIEQNSVLQQKYAIRGFPTVLLTDAEGNLLGKLGYEAGGPENWTRKASSLLR